MSDERSAAIGPVARHGYVDGREHPHVLAGVLLGAVDLQPGEVSVRGAEDGEGVAVCVDTACGKSSFWVRVKRVGWRTSK